MVVVPAGHFVMGSNELGNEMPAHGVTIGEPFAAGMFAVRFAQWDACVAAGSCSPVSFDRGASGNKAPVVGVSWDDVTQKYLPWLKRMTGKDYRLLSEAEWVFAARAEGATPDRSADAGPSANAFGLHDVGESAWEWVEDCYHKTYAGAPADGTAWTTDCEMSTYGSGILRVVRGTSRNIVPPNLSAAGIVPPLIAVSRNAGLTSFRDKSRGFRVARSL